MVYAAYFHAILDATVNFSWVRLDLKLKSKTPEICLLPDA